MMGMTLVMMVMIDDGEVNEYDDEYNDYDYAGNENGQALLKVNSWWPFYQMLAYNASLALIRVEA